MNYLKYIKRLFLFFLIFLLGTQTTYSKNEFVLLQNNVSFSTELNQNFKSLEKELQPNIGFLKEKCRFVVSEGVSAQKQYKSLYPILLGADDDSFPLDGEFNINANFETSFSTYNSITFDNNSQGYIGFYQTRYLKDNTIYITAPGTTIDRFSSYTYSEWFKPFEPVRILAKKDYYFLNLNTNNEVKEIVVPAILAALYQQLILNDQKEYEVRQFGNDVAMITAIAAVPFTGGTSFAAFAANAAVVGGGLAVIDTSITDYMQSIKGNPDIYAQHIEAYENWTRFYNTYQMIELATGLTQLGLKVGTIKNWNKFSNSVKNLPDEFNNTGTQIRNTLKDDWSLIKGLANTVDELTKLTTILQKAEFTTVFNKLKSLPTTPNRALRYASKNAFRDEFIRLHGLNNNGIKSLDNVLDDFDNLISNHSNIVDIEKYLDELLQSKNKFKGGAFGLEILNDLPPSLQGKILSRFEASIDDLEDAISGCRFDLQFSDGVKLVYVETKNYAKTTSFTSSFYNQFKAYVSNQNITSLDQIKYFFRANSGVTKSDRIQKFKNMLKKNNWEKADEIFNSLNANLKSKLGVNGLGGKTQFRLLIDDVGSEFYNFIEIF